MNFTDHQENKFAKKESFGKTVNGKEIHLYTLVNTSGLQIKIMDYGAIVQSLLIPDRNGERGDVVLGYDTYEDYLNDSAYFGAIIGRYCNRIANGKFVLDGTKYNLTINDGANHLHGGKKGFDKVVWDSESFSNDWGSGVKLSYRSPDGEQGYPGNLEAEVRYTLTERNELQISYKAKTDKATPCNLTHHSYFNLSGDAKRDIMNHECWINADCFTPVNESLIPTGEFRLVEGTPFDFTSRRTIGSYISEDDQQLKYAQGYDHNWCFNNADGALKYQASVYDSETGRFLEIFTTEPGMQMYSGNFLNKGIVGKGGKIYNQHKGLCFETQHFPDSPNHPNFPSSILIPGEVYHSQTVYRFSVQ